MFIRLTTLKITIKTIKYQVYSVRTLLRLLSTTPVALSGCFRHLTNVPVVLNHINQFPPKSNVTITLTFYTHDENTK